jgi:hypothetical protein
MKNFWATRKGSHLCLPTAKRQVLCWPRQAGKTTELLHIGEREANQGKKVCFVLPALVYERFLPRSHKYIVTTPRCLERLRGRVVDVFLVDDVDISFSMNSWMNFYHMYVGDARIVVAGTPVREDGVLVHLVNDSSFELVSPPSREVM